jgi:hypothetical protein
VFSIQLRCSESTNIVSSSPESRVNFGALAREGSARLAIHRGNVVSVGEIRFHAGKKIRKTENPLPGSRDDLASLPCDVY